MIALQRIIRKRSYSILTESKRLLRPSWNFQKIATPHVFSSGADKYKWMETYNKDVMRRLEEEDQFCSNILSSCSSTYDQLLSEISSFYEEECVDSMPYTTNGYSYYTRQSGEDYLPVFCRKAINSDLEEILLNLNTEFADSSVTVGNMIVSSENNFMAYTVDTTGEELYNLYIKDLSSGSIEIIKRNVYAMTFGLNDIISGENTILYSVANSLMRTNRIYKHTLGLSLTHDELIYEENNESYYCDVKKTKDCKYIIISSLTKSNSELYVQGGLCKKPTLLIKRRENEECYLDHILDYFVVVRNSQHKSFEVLLVNEKDVFNEIEDDANGLIDRCLEKREFIALTPSANSVSDIISDDYRIVDMDTMEKHIVLYEKSCHGYRIRSLQLDNYDNTLSISEQILPIDHLGDFIIGHNCDMKSKTVIYTLSNPVLRGDTYAYDLNTNTSELVNHLSMPIQSDIHEGEFELRTEYIKTTDGQDVPTTFVSRQLTAVSNPLLLSYYGCYGVDNPIHYHPPHLSLLKRGWTLGFPCIRGGGDKGPRWYRQGCRLNRANGVRDLDSVIGKLSSAHPICLSSNSAGGIITGSLLNMTNNKIQGALLHVPFLTLRDTLTNKDLPLTVTEFDEWGNPANEEEAKGIDSICPYTNLRKRDYPNMFFTCGLKDQRTPFYNTLKYINKLREMNIDDKTVQIMRCYSDGHFSENDPQLRVFSAAEQLSFLIHSVGGD